MFLTEKIHALDNLHSGLSYSAPGHEFSVNESTLYCMRCLSTETHLIYGSVDENVVTRGLQEPNPVFSPRNNGSLFTNSVSEATFRI